MLNPYTLPLLWLPLLWYPPPPLVFSAFWIIWFPPSYRPPSVAVVVVSPLSYTRSPPPFLAWNSVHLNFSHTHPPCQPHLLALCPASSACVEQSSLCLCVILFISVASTGNILGAFMKFFQMGDSLSSWSGIILVCTGYFHCDVTFWCFPISGITWGCASGVSALISSIFILGKFPFFLV